MNNYTILWKACEARFYMLRNGDPMIDANPITDGVAMQMRERGATFGENAARIVDNFIHNRNVTRGRTTWDKFMNMSERDERRMLKSEGEGD
jgi:hypothetical protein